MIARIAVTLLLVAGEAFSAAPKFEDYAEKDVFHGTPVQPILKTRGQHIFRTRIREAARKGANFAGHFAMAEWGCGAGCVSVAVVDVAGGAVYEGPFGSLPGAHVSFPASPDAGLSYRPDSRLLMVNGCPNEENCGVYYYEWTGTSFRLLKHDAP